MQERRPAQHVGHHSAFSDFRRSLTGSILEEKKWMGPAQGESIRAPPWHIEDMESSIAIICKKIFYLLPLINTVVVCGFIMVAYIITYWWHLCISDYNNKYLINEYWSTKEERDKTKVRGICFGVMFFILCLFTIISITRSTITNPGQIPNDWDTLSNQFILPRPSLDKEKKLEIKNFGEYGEKNQILQVLSMEEGTLIKHGNENTNNKMVFGDSFDSGYKSDALEEKQEDKIELPGGVDINSQNDPVKMCSKCIRNKPPRTHHCKVCGRCVLRMDHHCPWIINCVGFRNYKYFLLMLFYGGTTSLFIVLTYWEEVHLVSKTKEISPGYTYLVLLEYFLCISLAASLLGFLTFHLWMISKGVTTIEYCEKKVTTNGVVSKFNNGFANNLRAVLGHPCLFLLPFRPNYEGMGVYFESREDQMTSQYIST